MEVDVLALAAHPDDVELACSGTMIKLTDQGFRTGVVDFTRGEMGTRGTPETRTAESEAASKVMGLTVRNNLEMPDSKVEVTEEGKLRVVKALRAYRPKVVLCPYWENRHPDHAYAGRTVIDAAYLAGLKKLETDQEPFRPEKLVFYMAHYTFGPSFVVDITDTFDRKMEAVSCYRSQFYNEDSDEPETYISSPEFMDMLVSRMRYFGTLIGKKYGEPFFLRDSLMLNNIMNLVE